MSGKKVTTERAPKPLGPYSQAIIGGNTVYTAGVVGIDPVTGQMVSGGIREQTKEVLESLKAILEAAGTSLQNVVKVTVFLKDAAMFAEMNQVYSDYFGETRPARSTVVTGMVRPDILVEIEAVATIS